MGKDWLQIYLGHARECVHRDELQVEVVSHLWHVAWREHWDVLKAYLREFVPPDVFKTFGTGFWVDVDMPLSHHSYFTVGGKLQARFGDRTASIEKGQLCLMHGDHIVAHCIVENAPIDGWEEDEQVLTFSSDGKWLWHLGHRDGLTRVVLYDGEELNLVDEFAPTAGERWEFPTEQRVEFLYEQCVEARVSMYNPDILLVYAHGGDEIIWYKMTLFAVLEVVAGQIVDPIGPRLFDTVSEFLDGRIGSADFLSSDKFLVWDALGNTMVLSWPELDDYGKTSIQSEWIENDWKGQLWLGDETVDSIDFAITKEIGFCNKMVFFNAVHVDLHVLLISIVYDIESWKCIGFVFPPLCTIGKLISYKGIFFSEQKEKYRFWHYLPFEI